MSVFPINEKSSIFPANSEKKKAKKYNFELKTQSSVRYQARKEKLGSIIAPNISPDIYVT